ncbi:uncharacterized protein THITE_2058677 [Thermothielavioides terrestris NRRL 8126]|uniref:SnoaL-like domain-containing protein n=1 Tax=Thermothielavioides terrestris (strain ATCC 38088 / NRRL 8126) TaxID=578455 RepID=G2RHI8_THETT|nr:uncharacterized protein THITE_2058677 [Thermothielavioides terrestris NRRL 8126]AEO71300.1 hypothetical protein THITE_2058677 [Thermothielavioides terrestris NRRL 8126]
MALPYDVQTYLLDKENIRDTVIRMMLAFDDRATSTLIDSVYAPEILVHYPRLLFDYQKKVSSEEWAKMLEPLLDEFDTTEHIVHNLLIELPQPGKPGTQRPNSCKARAYAHGLFYKFDAEGRPSVMARRQGGGYELELVRVKEKEEAGENPWRISELKASFHWQDRGN